MQSVAPASAAVLAAVFLLLHSSGAWGAESTPTIAMSCGTSIQEAMAASEKALASKDSSQERTALVCELQALKLLLAAQPVTLRGRENHPVLRAPIWTPEK